MGSLTLCLLYTDRLRGVAYGPCLRHSGFVGIISAGLKSGVNKIGRAYGSRVIWEIVLVIIGKKGSPTLCLLHTDGLRGVASTQFVTTPACRRRPQAGISIRCSEDNNK